MKFVFIISLIIKNTILLAQSSPVSDTIRPTRLALFESITTPIDSNILIVVNGEQMGTLAQVKKNVRELFPSDIIDTIILTNPTEGKSKYSKYGNNGALEFVLKKQTLPVKNNRLNSLESYKKFDDIIIDSFPPTKNADWRKHLERWISNEIAEEKGAPKGQFTVLVQFLVTADGSIIDIRPLTNHGFGMEEDVIRVILRAPKFSPATYNGKPVKFLKTQPVIYSVNPRS